MATIYRFIVEQQATASDGRKNSGASGISKKTPSKKGKAVSIFGGIKGGVEHNRKLRAINPLINKATGGFWEKGLRVSRAASGLVKVNEETGKFAGLSGTAIAIIIAFVIQTLLKYQAQQRNIANTLNAQNYKALENGFGAVHGDYEITANVWTGRLTYNQNK